MKVEQISIFLENKSERLAEVSAVLAGSGINIRPSPCRHLSTSAYCVLLLMILRRPNRC